MHEMGIICEVLDQVARRAGEAKVRRIVLEVGRLTAVDLDALRFAFELACPETPLAGAELDIIDIVGQARCNSCSATIEVDWPVGMCSCGGIDLEWLAGDELRIRGMEVI